MRYRWMVSDGDSKAFSSVEDIYDGIKVEKLDCVWACAEKDGETPAEFKVNNKGKA